MMQSIIINHFLHRNSHQYPNPFSFLRPSDLRSSDIGIIHHGKTLVLVPSHVFSHDHHRDRDGGLKVGSSRGISGRDGDSGRPLPLQLLLLQPQAILGRAEDQELRLGALPRSPDLVHLDGVVDRGAAPRPPEVEDEEGGHQRPDAGHGNDDEEHQLVQELEDVLRRADDDVAVAALADHVICGAVCGSRHDSGDFWPVCGCMYV